DLRELAPNRLGVLARRGYGAGVERRAEGGGRQGHLDGPAWRPDRHAVELRMPREAVHVVDHAPGGPSRIETPRQSVPVERGERGDDPRVEGFAVGDARDVVAEARIGSHGGILQ